MKHKKRIFIIKEPTFKTAASFLINIPFSGLEKWYVKRKFAGDPPLDKKYSTDNGVVFSLKNINGVEGYIIWMPHFDWTVKDISILGHEMVHLSHFIADSKGIPVRSENSEVIAYLMEYYLSQALKRLNR